MSEQDKPGDSPKLHIDADWKAQAQADKQKLQEELDAQAEQGGGGEGEMPPADFKTLVSSLVSQALLYMGAIPDPMTGQRIAHLDLAQHHIDLLAVLGEKTKGNLDEEEQQLVTQALHELRQHFVQLSKQMAAHQAKQAAQKLQQGGGGMSGGGMGGGAGGPGGAGGGGGLGGIIDPSKM